ncbi:MAG: NAD(P)H-dependent oxidoreductase subunit E [Spirochaetales bacterium]|uniref:NAD(P)H-dependent oxidoreductase subunit E n=1 Tax=Candidatus Thalassospirochaeta sargassi TaxID=3119039 RepID=A0AAJ1MJT5_9SPIO|nr:NAD(P)H-dependent oxidoreductase subunit E [Spirochaetales bacterium]
MITVEICMGSSCYSRGNSQSLEIVENYIKEKKLEDQIKLQGKLCLENCSEGPNIIVNGNIHRRCNPECVIDLISHYMEKK